VHELKLTQLHVALNKKWISGLTQKPQGKEKMRDRTAGKTVGD